MNSKDALGALRKQNIHIDITSAFGTGNFRDPSTLPGGRDDVSEKFYANIKKFQIII